MRPLELVDDARPLVDEALLLLDRVGVEVECEQARALLLEGGCRQHAGRTCFPEAVVCQAISTAPHRVRLYDRAGHLALDLGGGTTHFDPGSAAIHLHTPDQPRRAAVTADLVRLARLTDALPGYEAQATALTPGDVPQEIGDRYRLHLALVHSAKPVVTGTWRVDGFAPMHAMLAAVRGGEQALRERPLALFDCCPTPPLRWSELASRTLVSCARAGVPANLVGMPMAGATAPVGLREVAVQHCAENLSGLVLHQLAAPGAPVVWGGSAAGFDMRQGAPPMGSMESMMLAALTAQTGRALGLPTHAYAVLTEAKVLDYQAGLESGLGALVAVLAGVDLVSGPGMMDYQTTWSLEKLVLDHEALGAVRRLSRGVARIQGDTLPLFQALAASGQLLGHDHTRANWRSELHHPSPVLERRSHGDWASQGGSRADQRALDRVERLLSRHRADPLEPALTAELARIMEAEARAWGVDRLPAC